MMIPGSPLLSIVKLPSKQKTNEPNIRTSILGENVGSDVNYIPSHWGLSLSSFTTRQLKSVQVFFPLALACVIVA